MATEVRTLAWVCVGVNVVSMVVNAALAQPVGFTASALGLFAMGVYLFGERA